MPNMPAFVTVRRINEDTFSVLPDASNMGPGSHPATIANRKVLGSVVTGILNGFDFDAPVSEPKPKRKAKAEVTSDDYPDIQPDGPTGDPHPEPGDGEA